MQRLLEQMPVEAVVVVPFAPLAELAPMNISFLPGCAYMNPYSARSVAAFCQSSPGILPNIDPLP